MQLTQTYNINHVVVHSKCYCITQLSMKINTEDNEKVINSVIFRLMKIFVHRKW